MTELVRLDFRAAGIDGNRVVVRNRGTLLVDAVIATSGGGQATLQKGPGPGSVLRLPEVSHTDLLPRAVVVVTAGERGLRLGQLDPGARDFAFGAAFSLDADSAAGGRLDNGNNLVQRGLSTDPAQYKIQVDHGRVSCRVLGDEGSLLVTTETQVVPDEWYTVTCTRRGEDLTLDLEGAGGDSERATASGPTGSVVDPVGTPLAVGGKVTLAGNAIRGDSDQFNGAVNAVFLRVAADG